MVLRSRCHTGIIIRRVAMKNLFNRFVREEQGQDLIEYALLAGFISLAVVTAVTNVGTALDGLYDNVETKVKDAAS